MYGHKNSVRGKKFAHGTRTSQKFRTRNLSLKKEEKALLKLFQDRSEVEDRME